MAIPPLPHRIVYAGPGDTAGTGQADSIRMYWVTHTENSPLRAHYSQPFSVVAYKAREPTFFTSGMMLPAPNRNGNVIHINSDKVGRIFFLSNIPLSVPHEMHHCVDRTERKFILVPANDGFVPVRHGTDPQCDNWLSTASLVRTVYDKNRVRHPACNIDYKEHGFTLKGKVWWPIKNGPFVPSFKRIREPYVPDYEQVLTSQERDSWNLITVAAGGLGALAGALAVPGAVIPEVILNAAEVSTGARALTSLFQNALKEDPKKVEAQAQILTMRLLDAQDSEDLSNKIIEAVDQNLPLATVQALLTDNEEIILFVEHRGKAAIKAAAFGMTQMLKLLLDSGPITVEDRAEAVKIAVEHMHDGTVETLLENNAAVPSELLGPSVIAAAIHQSPLCLEKLLKGRNILQDDRGQAVIAAAEHGHEQNMDLLLQNNAQISVEHRGLAVIKSCWGKTTNLQKLLNNGSITREARGAAVMEAVKEECKGHLDLLLTNQVIPLNVRGDAALEAATRGKKKMLDALLKNGRIPRMAKKQIDVIQAEEKDN